MVGTLKWLQMFAELQMLTPLVPTREVYFVRYCKQLSAEQWAIVDVSIDKVEENIDASLLKCRKRPSGCIIQDKTNGHCKVYIHMHRALFGEIHGLPANLELSFSFELIEFHFENKLMNPLFN